MVFQPTSAITHNTGRSPVLILQRHAWRIAENWRIARKRIIIRVIGAVGCTRTRFVMVSKHRKTTSYVPVSHKETVLFLILFKGIIKFAIKENRRKMWNALSKNTMKKWEMKKADPQGNAFSLKVYISVLLFLRL